MITETISACCALITVTGAGWGAYLLGAIRDREKENRLKLEELFKQQATTERRVDSGEKEALVRNNNNRDARARDAVEAVREFASRSQVLAVEAKFEAWMIRIENKLDVLIKEMGHRGD